MLFKDIFFSKDLAALLFGSGTICAILVEGIMRNKSEIIIALI